MILAATLTHPIIPSDLEICWRIVLAGFLVALVGLERECTDHPSGLRTHMLVGMGACLFGLCSAYGFQEFIALRESNNYQIDVARIASNVVVGVGFLGGGAIVKHGNSVRGMTSAAGLWVSAAIGLSVAIGLYWVAIATTAMLLLTLIFLKFPGKFIRSKMGKTSDIVVVRAKLDTSISTIISYVNDVKTIEMKDISIDKRIDDNIIVVKMVVLNETGKDYIPGLGEIDGVMSIEVA